MVRTKGLFPSFCCRYIVHLCSWVLVTSEATLIAGTMTDELCQTKHLCYKKGRKTVVCVSLTLTKLWPIKHDRPSDSELQNQPICVWSLSSWDILPTVDSNLVNSFNKLLIVTCKLLVVIYKQDWKLPKKCCNYWLIHCQAQFSILQWHNHRYQTPSPGMVLPLVSQFECTCRYDVVIHKYGSI